MRDGARTIAASAVRGAAVTIVVIDGQAVPVRRGGTLLEGCRANGIAIPSLCHLDGVSAAGACRLCLVEVKGLARPVAACSTPALDGMVVVTSTDRLRAHRRNVVEMLLAGGDHVCAFCPASGRCELQALARELGVDHFSPAAAPSHGHRRAVDASRQGFALDPGRCILCSRCVRVCTELERAQTLAIGGRGAATHLFTDGGDRWSSSASCTDCGRCVAVCPTGALFEKTAAPAAHPAAAGATRPHAGTPTSRRRVATVWLGGCSGCHMSLLDLDEQLVEVWRRIDLVYSPLVDAKQFPEDVDLCLVEGAIANGHDLALLTEVRSRSRLLVALGDCAVNGNVTAMRNARGGPDAVLRRAWIASARPQAVRAAAGVPALLDPVRPLQDAVDVDLFLPGCPPPSSAIGRVLTAFIAGEPPSLPDQATTRFG